LDRAESDGLLRNASMCRAYQRFFGADGQVRSGTFLLDPRQDGRKILDVLLREEPIRQMVLIREGLWTAEVAAILDQKSVVDAKSFRVIAAHPDNFDKPYLLPKQSLEGYLFPDTYDLPPLLGAQEAVERMLEAFEAKVYVPLGKPSKEKLRLWVIIGSLIELEALRDDERRTISGVIANRLSKGLPLQIDATILYALKERRRLFTKDYGVNSVYNTYKFTGLPPGPICSPGIASIKAAANPGKHSFLYYVAMPDGSHKFARTYAEHLANVAASRKAFQR
jgi:UPF0755 protein